MAGLASLRVVQAGLPSARGSDGGGAPRSAVCRRQLAPLGADQVTRAPKTTWRRKRGRLWIHR
jgi:hypothetical protein